MPTDHTDEQSMENIDSRKDLKPALMVGQSYDTLTSIPMEYR